MQGPGGRPPGEGARPGGGRWLAGRSAAAPHYGGCWSERQWGEPCPLPRRWRRGEVAAGGRAASPPAAPSSLLSSQRAARASRSGRGLALPRGPPGPGAPGAGVSRRRPAWASVRLRTGRVCARGRAGTLRAPPGGGIAGGTKGGGRGEGRRAVPGARPEWRWRPGRLPPPPCWYGRFLIMCSRRRRPEPGARERPSPGRSPRQRPRPEPGSRGRSCPARAGSERLRGCWEGE